MTQEDFLDTIRRAFNHLIAQGLELPINDVRLENCGFGDGIMTWMTLNQEYCIRWSFRDQWTFFKDFDEARSDEESGDDLIKIIEKVIKRERLYQNTRH